MNTAGDGMYRAKVPLDEVVSELPGWQKLEKRDGLTDLAKEEATGRGKIGFARLQEIRQFRTRSIRQLVTNIQRRLRQDSLNIGNPSPYLSRVRQNDHGWLRKIGTYLF
jgi:hypothetical protein